MDSSIIQQRKRASVERINKLIRDLRADIGIAAAMPNPRVSAIEGDRAGELQALENLVSLLEDLQMRIKTFRYHGHGSEAKVMEHKLPQQSSGAPLVNEADAARMQREAQERHEARQRELDAIESKRQAALATARDKTQPELKRIRASERAANLLNRSLRKKNGVSGRNGR